MYRPDAWIETEKRKIMDEMRLRFLTIDNRKELDWVKALYETAFPADERRDFALVTELLRTKPEFQIRLIEADRLPVGFLSSWHWNGLSYVEHFAVDPACRNGGFGKRALQTFLQSVGTPVVLEVEKPADDLSRRRIGFYERSGFRLSDYPYIQPPYSPELNSLPMCLMWYGGDPASFSPEAAARQLHREVYGVEV